MGWLKVLRDPFLVCGPVNKTVQYFGIFSLLLGRVVWNAGGFLVGNPLELQPMNKTEGKAGSSTEFCAYSVAHLKDLGGESVLLCPEALTVYIVQ